MATYQDELHVFFLPFLTPGHMLPIVDMARRFAEHGVKSTIVTTPVNVARIQPSVDRANNAGYHLHKIQLLQIPFPSSAAGLPEGWENLTFFPSPAITPEFFKALSLLRQPFDQLLSDHHPDCVISDGFYPWTNDSADELEIPRLVFPPLSCFTIEIHRQLRIHKPHDRVFDDDESFVVPGLPHRVELRKSQLSAFVRRPSESFSELDASFRRSYGQLMNSFVELEFGYVPVNGQLKTWLVGPLSLCNREVGDKEARGHELTSNAEHCLQWLDRKEPKSVLYICFGSLGIFTTSQLQETAVGLDSSGHSYIWVVKDTKYVPEGFEGEKKNGLVVKGWVPQILILNHEAVGGFMTHCGWNSCLEGVTAGVPMVTWPLFADQFYNQRLVVDVLRIGVEVGACRSSPNEEERGLVMSSQIQKAVDAVMGGGEGAEARRKRVEELGVMAKAAVEESGSSYNNMVSLLEELKDLKRRRTNNTRQE